MQEKGIKVLRNEDDGELYIKLKDVKEFVNEDLTLNCETKAQLTFIRDLWTMICIVEDWYNGVDDDFDYECGLQTYDNLIF